MDQKFVLLFNSLKSEIKWPLKHKTSFYTIWYEIAEMKCPVFSPFFLSFLLLQIKFPFF